MTRQRLIGSVLAAGLGAALVALAPVFARQPAPVERLTDQAFWRLIVESSEPGGYFRSQDITNLTSNELALQAVIPELVRRTKPGSVYLGVGPEQNFTYMVAVRPSLAFILDIRRGNLDLQLMYKAIFELARDRADFLSMLFARPRPAGVGPASSVEELFQALARMPASESAFRQHLAAIENRLVRVHGFALRAGDVSGIRAIYQTFYYSGAAIRPFPTYEDLMLATDAEGVNRSFLANEESFVFLKDLQMRNLVVPVVGDFGGPRAIRAIAAYLKAQKGLVGAFYLSNVEQYLYQDGRWDAFCRNVATLPTDASSTFIRSTNAGGFGFGRGGGFVSSLGVIAEDLAACAGAK